MSMSGYQRLKMAPNSPSRVFTRVCSNTYAPSLDHCICCFVQKRLFTRAWRCSGSLNLSQFVEDQNGPNIGQTLPFSLCSRPLGLMPPVRLFRPARTHSGAESSARIERSPHSLGGCTC